MSEWNSVQDGNLGSLVRGAL
eukprot:COSAG02_NODE_12648_length_1514_cov_2.187279_2_plen_20_part_01